METWAVDIVQGLAVKILQGTEEIPLVPMKKEVGKLIADKLQIWKMEKKHFDSTAVNY